MLKSEVEVMDKPMIDVMARVTRRIDRPERGLRCRKRSKAALSIGALLLLFGGVDRPRMIEAQQVARREGEATASTSLAEARIEVAHRALNSIKRRESNGSAILYNEILHGIQEQGDQLTPRRPPARGPVKDPLEAHPELV